MNVNDDPLNGQDIGLEFMRNIEKSMSSEEIALHISSKLVRSTLHHGPKENVFSFNDFLFLYAADSLYIQPLYKKLANKNSMLHKKASDIVFQI